LRCPLDSGRQDFVKTEVDEALLINTIVEYYETILLSQAGFRRKVDFRELSKDSSLVR